MRHLTVQQLSASLDGALVGVSLELVVRHLATCRECRDRHARLSKQDETLRHLLAWDPGAEYFEDASIRLEAILDAESRGVAPPQPLDLEAHLPRVTLDDVLRTAREAVAPKPRPTASAEAPPPPAATGPASPERNALQFPTWMQRQAPAAPAPEPTPSAPQQPAVVASAQSALPPAAASAPAPAQPPAPEPAPNPTRVERARIIPIEPVILARKESATTPAPAPVDPLPSNDPPPMPMLERAIPVDPAPFARPIESPTLVHEPDDAVLTAEAPREQPARRRPATRWIRPLVFAAVGVAALVAAWSALPPVIQIAEPTLPRLPRIEVVKRPTAPPTARTTVPAATAAPASTVPATAAPTPPAVPLNPVPTPAPVTPARVVPARVEPAPRTAAPAASQPPASPPAQLPAQPTPAPSRAEAPATTTPAAPATTRAPETEAAADWPLLCGEVLDDSGAPVAGARVMLADLDLSARTDRRGRFCIAAPPGDRTLSVIALGFSTTRQVVSLGAQTLEVRLTLKPTN